MCLYLISGHTVVDVGEFAHAVFPLKQQDGLWSLPQMISNIGLVERDINNVGSRKSTSISMQPVITRAQWMPLLYRGTGTTFRWKKHAYLPLAGSFNSRGRRVHTAAVLKTSCMILNPWKESPSGLGAHKST